MLSKYMKHLTNNDCPVVLSITEPPAEAHRTPVIQRNNLAENKAADSADIYLRAREIYLRARRSRPVRAASIF